MTKDERRTHRVASRWLWSCPWLVCLLTGCATASTWDWLPWKKKEAPPETAKAPRDSFVMRGVGLERDRPADPSIDAELESAKRQFQAKEYRKAEAAFHKLANNKKAPVNVLDEALYYEAECQRLQNNLRDAEGTFRKYIKEFRVNGQYVEQANRKLFDIANYWLDDTRQQMAAYEEKREGKRWFILPGSFMHLTRDKPLFDMEGHALQVLEDVGLNDIRGTIRTVDGGPSLGERAMFYLATVKFFREDFREADYYYSQLYENHPNSPLAPKAIKQSIICKQVMNGGTAYDTRCIEESRKLIDRYQGAYPEWRNDHVWLERQLGSIHLQQADRDLKIAEFYRRTGHPGSAYFYYELVRRRYPNTEFSKKADERLTELRGLAEREHNVTRDGPGAFESTPTAPRTSSQAEAPNAFTPPPPAPTLPAPNAFTPPENPGAGSQPPAPLPVGVSQTPASPRLLPPNLGPGSN